MKNNKIFIACDSTNISKIKEIINKTKNSKLKIGYKFGLEFLNSKQGRIFLSKLKNKITFADLKIHDIPNTCVSAIKAIKDLKVNYLTIHISSGLEALKNCNTIDEKNCNPKNYPAYPQKSWKIFNAIVVLFQNIGEIFLGRKKRFRSRR